MKTDGLFLYFGKALEGIHAAMGSVKESTITIR